MSSCFYFFSFFLLINAFKYLLKYIPCPWCVGWTHWLVDKSHWHDSNVYTMNKGRTPVTVSPYVNWIGLSDMPSTSLWAFP